MGYKAISLLACVILVVLQVNVSHSQLAAVPGGAPSLPGGASSPPGSISTPTKVTQNGFQKLGQLIYQIITGLLGNTTLNLPLDLDIPLTLNLPPATIKLIVDAKANITVKSPDVFVFASVGLGLEVNVTLSPSALSSLPIGSVLSSLPTDQLPTAAIVTCTGINITIEVTLVTSPNGDLSLNVSACLIVFGKFNVQLSGGGAGSAVTQQLLNILSGPLAKALPLVLQDQLCLIARVAIDQFGLQICLMANTKGQVNKVQLPTYQITLLQLNVADTTVDAILTGLMGNATANGLCGTPGTGLTGLLGGLSGSGGPLGGGSGSGSSPSGSTGAGGGLLGGLIGTVDGLLSGLLGGTGLRRKRQLSALPGTGSVPATAPSSSSTDIMENVTGLLNTVLNLVCAALQAVCKTVVVLLEALSCIADELGVHVPIPVNVSMCNDLGSEVTGSTNGSCNLGGTITFLLSGKSPIVIGVSSVVNFVAGLNGNNIGVIASSIESKVEDLPDVVQGLLGCVTKLVDNLVSKVVGPLLSNVTNTVFAALPFAEHLVGPVLSTVEGVSTIASGLNI